jgi:aminoglycoside phosphotransferase (APT) family kinase protein
MPKDLYLQPDAPDPVLDSEVVLTLARRHVPSVRAVTAVDESGGEARTYVIDGDLIFKTQRPQQLRPRTSLAKEVFFLNQIAAVLPDLSVPRVLGYGREGPYIEYTLMTRMPGVALRHANLNGTARLEVMRALGHTLRRIHQMPQAPFVESGLFPGDTNAADVRRRFAEWFDEFAARIHKEQCPWTLQMTPEAVAERALSLLPDSDERVALHSNPWHEHTFVDPEKGKYTGLIDFGDAYISHPTFDLRRWRTREERAALLAGYTREHPVSDEFWATWFVAQVLGDMAAIAGSSTFGPAALADLEWLLTQF